VARRQTGSEGEFPLSQGCFTPNSFCVQVQDGPDLISEDAACVAAQDDGATPTSHRGVSSGKRFP
jgi:hypothetical protein